MKRSSRLATLMVLSCLALLPPAVRAGPVQGGWLPQPLFPADNWWNTDISWAPVDWNSDNYSAYIQQWGSLPLHPFVGGDYWQDGLERNWGFPYIVVNGWQPRLAVDFLYATSSDGVDPNTWQSYPFYPIPDEAIWNYHWIQGGLPGYIDDRPYDRHMLIVDIDNNYLYELFGVWFDRGQWRWRADAGAFFDMNLNYRRPDGWASSEESGLALLPGMLRYDEVYGPDEINHALGTSVPDSNGYVYPASNSARWSSGAPPLGARLRLRADVDISGFPWEVQKIFRAMKRYGLIATTVGDTYLQIAGTYDLRWNNDILNPALNALHAADFEFVELGWAP
jgi:hypothetical protein